MERISIAEKSYCEVLDATKHQDDKVGRVITAAAFLTTGALTLITHTFAASTRLDLPGDRIPVVAIGIGAYFGCTAFAVIALLLSLSTPHVYLSDVDKGNDSLLFFNEISRKSSNEWNAIWDKSDEELNSILQRNFQVESLNLARRVSLKYKRTFTAVHVFELGVFYLAIGVIAYLLAFVQASGSAEHPGPIVPNFLVRTIFLLGAATYLELSLRAIREQALYDRKDWPRLTANQRYRRRVTSRLARTTLIALVWFEGVLVMAPRSYSSWIWLLSAAGIIPMGWAFSPAKDDRCKGINGGEWSGIFGHPVSYKTFYILVQAMIDGAILAMGIAVSALSTSKSAEARLAAAASLPVMLMVAAVLQRATPSRRLLPAETPETAPAEAE